MLRSKPEPLPKQPQIQPLTSSLPFDEALKRVSPIQAALKVESDGNKTVVKPTDSTSEIVAPPS